MHNHPTPFLKLQELVPNIQDQIHPCGPCCCTLTDPLWVGPDGPHLTAHCPVALLNTQFPSAV